MKKKLKKTGKAKLHRDKEKNVTFNLKRMVANRREQLQVDYINKLSDKEKDWLNRFNEEYVLANFKHPGKIIDGSKKAKKKSYDANNARNRCVYTMSKVSNKLQTITYQQYSDLDVTKSVTSPEDAIIEL